MLSGCKYRMCRKVRVKRMSIFFKFLLIFLLFLPESYFIKLTNYCIIATGGPTLQNRIFRQQCIISEILVISP